MARKKSKFKPTLNRSFLALVVVLLFSVIGGIIIGLRNSSAASLDINTTISSGQSRTYTLYGRSGRACFRFQKSSSNTANRFSGSATFSGKGASSSSSTGDSFTINQSGTLDSPACKDGFDAPGGSATFTVKVNSGSLYLKKITWQ